MQNWPAGVVKSPVWPISHTNEFGASLTRPQLRALPIVWVSNAGIKGPSTLLSSTIVPEWPVVRSVTVMCVPSAAGVAYWWSVIVSPACIINGPPLTLSVSIALKAADSELPLRETSNTGEQAV